MANPTAAILIIGDEILSGRTQDTNTHFLAGELTAHGITLKQVRVVADDREAIVNAVHDLSPDHTHVFTSGGIGPTHDDITADCIAAAFGVPIGIRDDARALLTGFYQARNADVTAARLRMARIPEGATLIDNPVSVAPGFTLKNVHVMAGVPAVFRAMVAGLLPTLAGGTPLLSKTLRLMYPESHIAKPLGAIARANPDISVGSYPFNQDGKYGTNIVARGPDVTRLDAVLDQLAKKLDGGTA
jgi:molybdenum cofactor synthesis domain-containing protein